MALATEGKLPSSYQPTIGVEFNSRIFTVLGHHKHLQLQLWVSSVSPLS